MAETPNLDAQVNGPQYLGPATFMKVRALTEPEELERVAPDVAIVGAPWDDGTTYRPGARFGPRAVRVANYQPPSWHLDLQVAPFEVLTVVDYGDAVCYPGLTEQAHEAIRARVAEVASRQIVPSVIGGDHSITYSSATPVADRRPRVHLPLGRHRCPRSRLRPRDRDAGTRRDATGRSAPSHPQHRTADEIGRNGRGRGLAAARSCGDHGSECEPLHTRGD